MTLNNDLKNFLAVWDKNIQSHLRVITCAIVIIVNLFIGPKGCHCQTTMPYVIFWCSY